MPISLESIEDYNREMEAKEWALYPENRGVWETPLLRFPDTIEIIPLEQLRSLLLSYAKVLKTMYHPESQYAYKDKPALFSLFHNAQKRIQQADDATLAIWKTEVLEAIKNVKEYANAYITKDFAKQYSSEMIAEQFAPYKEVTHRVTQNYVNKTKKEMSKSNVESLEKDWYAFCDFSGISTVLSWGHGGEGKQIHQKMESRWSQKEEVQERYTYVQSCIPGLRSENIKETFSYLQALEILIEGVLEGSGHTFAEPAQCLATKILRRFFGKKRRRSPLTAKELGAIAVDIIAFIEQEYFTSKETQSTAVAVVDQRSIKQANPLLTILLLQIDVPHEWEAVEAKEVLAKLYPLFLKAIHPDILGQDPKVNEHFIDKYKEYKRFIDIHKDPSKRHVLDSIGHAWEEVDVAKAMKDVIQQVRKELYVSNIQGPIALLLSEIQEDIARMHKVMLQKNSQKLRSEVLADMVKCSSHYTQLHDGEVPLVGVKSLESAGITVHYSSTMLGGSELPSVQVFMERLESFCRAHEHQWGCVLDTAITKRAKDLILKKITALPEVGAVEVVEVLQLLEEHLKSKEEEGATPLSIAEIAAGLQIISAMELAGESGMEAYQQAKEVYLREQEKKYRENVKSRLYAGLKSWNYDSHGITIPGEQWEAFSWFVDHGLEQYPSIKELYTEVLLPIGSLNKKDPRKDGGQHMETMCIHIGEEGAALSDEDVVQLLAKRFATKDLGEEQLRRFFKNLCNWSSTRGELLQRLQTLFGLTKGYLSPEVAAYSQTIRAIVAYQGKMEKYTEPLSQMKKSLGSGDPKDLLAKVEHLRAWDTSIQERLGEDSVRFLEEASMALQGNQYIAHYQNIARQFFRNYENLYREQYHPLAERKFVEAPQGLQEARTRVDKDISMYAMGINNAMKRIKKALEKDPAQITLERHESDIVKKGNVKLGLSKESCTKVLGMIHDMVDGREVRHIKYNRQVVDCTNFPSVIIEGGHYKVLGAVSAEEKEDMSRILQLKQRSTQYHITTEHNRTFTTTDLQEQWHKIYGQVRGGVKEGDYLVVYNEKRTQIEAIGPILHLNVEE